MQTKQVQVKHLKQGQRAEELAAIFLQNNGLKLIEKNFRCKYGEIDLIMQHHKTLVFIEVRLRSNAMFGGAAMSIDQAKQRKLSRSAEFYLQTHASFADQACRFDAILLQSTSINALEWIQNAF